MAPPSIFRGPDAKHYAVVHRSQRDPLINDPEAGERVLHEVQRQNDTNKQRKQKLTKGLTRDELESSLGQDASTLRSNVGEASMYSIYYDDSEYDYMQHLKPVGVTKEAILLDAPTTTKEPQKSQSIQLRATSPGGGEGGQKEGLRLPNSVQPTPHEQMLSYQDHLQYALPSHSAIPDHGLFPLDDDPALREVLEALEDDAYVEEEIQDEFFGTIVKDGEREPDEEPEWIHQIQSSSSSSQWESEMARFKKPHSTSTDTASSIGSLSAASSNKRKLATHQKLQGRDSVNGSAFSMSSSAMFRNEGLTDLDDRFDQIEKEYESDGDSDEGSEDGDSECSNETAMPGPVRADFEEIMDDFLERFEVLGGKMKPVMSGKTAVEKLDTLRTELLGPNDPDSRAERAAVKDQILQKLKADQRAHDRQALSSSAIKSHQERFMTLPNDDHLQNKWDCQTILTTYSNLENHPRVIRIRDAIGADNPNKKNKKKAEQEEQESSMVSSEPKIGIDRITGFPIVNGQIIKGNQSIHHLPKNGETPAGDEDDSDSDGDSSGSVRETIKRDRNEDKEAKKARKAEVKAERAARRQQKKTVKLTFNSLKNQQDKIHSKLLSQKSNDIAGLGGKGIMTLL